MPTRREGVGRHIGKAGKALVMAAILEAGLPTLDRHAYAQGAKVEHETAIPLSVERQITLFQKDKISLDEREILAELQRNGVGEGARIFNIEVPAGERLWLDDQTWFGKRLRSIANSGRPQGLNVIRVDFTRSDQDLGGMSYWQDYRALFINSVPNPEKRRENMELILAFHLVTLLRQTAAVHLSKQRARIGDKAFFDRLRENEKFFNKLQRTKQRLNDFNHATLQEYEKALLHEAKTYRLNWARKYVHDTYGLPHEIFHHKFETQLFTKDYQGPSAGELVAAALKNQRDRFEGRAGAYGVSRLIPEIERVTGQRVPTTDHDLAAFGGYLAQHFDITKGYDYPDDAISRLSRKEQLRFDLRYYLNEYLARIYAGALGGTPLNLYQKMSILGRTHAHRAKYLIDVRSNFHEPSEQEFSLLGRMQYKGEPMIHK